MLAGIYDMFYWTEKRIRNPLYLHRYLGFESLSLRHIKNPYKSMNYKDFGKVILYQRFVPKIALIFGLGFFLLKL